VTKTVEKISGKHNLIPGGYDNVTIWEWFVIQSLWLAV